ncbi:hypothetical protein B0H10DRAFT_1947370 [Mycena sp. CBHHK59/15]|nr:hypothetical protein B0H10DRAFT_1947370 [Mycena sp. CBHHK59/15]
MPKVRHVKLLLTWGCIPMPPTHSGARTALAKAFLRLEWLPAKREVVARNNSSSHAVKIVSTRSYTEMITHRAAPASCIAKTVPSGVGILASARRHLCFARTKRMTCASPFAGDASVWRLPHGEHCGPPDCGFIERYASHPHDNPSTAQSRRRKNRSRAGTATWESIARGQHGAHGAGSTVGSRVEDMKHGDGAQVDDAEMCDSRPENARVFEINLVRRGSFFKDATWAAHSEESGAGDLEGAEAKRRVRVIMCTDVTSIPSKASSSCHSGPSQPNLKHFSPATYPASACLRPQSIQDAHRRSAPDRAGAVPNLNPPLFRKASYPAKPPQIEVANQLQTVPRSAGRCHRLLFACSPVASASNYPDSSDDDDDEPEPCEFYPSRMVKSRTNAWIPIRAGTNNFLLSAVKIKPLSVATSGTKTAPGAWNSENSTGSILVALQIVKMASQAPVPDKRAVVRVGSLKRRSTVHGKENMHSEHTLAPRVSVSSRR